MHSDLLWNQDPYPNVSLSKLLEHKLDASGGHGLSWAMTDETADGGAAFRYSIDIRPSLNRAHHGSVVWRAVSLFLLSQLNDASLKEAVGVLKDIYDFQSACERKPLQEPSVRHLGSFKPKLVEREPFSIER